MKILIAGDFYPRYRIAEKVEAGDFSFFDDIRKETEKADFSIVNFEFPIATSEDKPIAKNGPNLKGADKSIEAIKYAGFDIATLANNHTLDYGESALKRTISALESKGVRTVGAGDNLAEAGKIIFIQKLDKTLAIINCCEHEFSIADDDSAGANPLDPIRQYRQIQDAKRNADYVLVIVHGGHEHFQLPSPRMQDTYRFFIEAGADAVVNHHQHCFSGFETYQGKPIIYGLGNLCFDNGKTSHTGWNDGYMVSIDFGDEITFEVIPYMQCAEEATVKTIPVGSFDEKLAELNGIIQDSTKLRETVEKYYESCRNSVELALEPKLGRFILALQYRKLFPRFAGNKMKTILQNSTNCEAHLDKLRYVLKNR